MPDQVLDPPGSQLDTVAPVSQPPAAISWIRLSQIGYSLTDQALAVGGMFLANVVLARVQSKEEYGMFALSYSVYTFIAGIHNALILEPYSIHGGGRYNDRFSTYSRYMSRNNALLGVGLTATFVCIWFVLQRYEPSVASKSFLGLALAAPILLSALFIRRTLYLRRRPELAARFSVVSFVALVLLLAMTTKAGLLTGFSIFLISALAWIVAGLILLRELPGVAGTKAFTDNTPGHWTEHWKYARWVLVTAFVFQLTNQAYYWFLAGFISVKQVAELRAMYLLLGPVDQILIAIDLLILPVMAYRFASRQDKKLVSLWWMFGAMTVAITLAYAACMWIFGGRLMHLLYKGKFDDVSTLLAAFALLPVIMGIGNSLNVALKSMERPDSVFFAYFASGLATAVWGTVLVRHLGLRGAVYGMLISAGVYTLVMLVGLLLVSRSNRISVLSLATL
jgi:O-antigen/teichoic acid export membrane protein